MLRLLAMLSLATSAACWPMYWIDPQHAVEMGADPVPASTPGCLEHPDKPYGTHSESVDDSKRMLYRLLQNGKATTKVCPGYTYSIELSFTDDDRRYALLTASQGTLQKPYNDAKCPGRIVLDSMMSRDTVRSRSNKFTVPLSLPCDTSGPLVIKSTTANWGDDYFNQASVSFTVTPSCAAAACSDPNAPAVAPTSTTPSTPTANSTTTNDDDDDDDDADGNHSHHDHHHHHDSDDDETTSTTRSAATTSTAAATSTPPAAALAFPKAMCNTPKQANPSCTPSPLGYSCSSAMDHITLHWTIGGCPPSNPCTAAYRLRSESADPAKDRMLHMAVQANTTGYVAVAFARDPGSMLHSDTVLGWVADDGQGVVEAYKVHRYGLSSTDAYTAASQWLYYSGAITQDGQTTLCFTRPLATPSALHSPSLEPSTPISMLYAIGRNSQRSLSRHSHDGGFTLNMVTGSSSMKGESDDWIPEIHGILMVLAWGLLAPLGVVVARRRGVLQGKRVLGAEAWFQAHRAAQLGAVAAFIAGLVLGFVYLAEGYRTPLMLAHRILAIILASSVGLQVVLGVVRPDKEHSLRALWLRAHRWLGALSLVMALANMFIGAKLYQEDRGMSLAVWVVPIVALVGGVAALDAVLWWRGSRTEAAGKPEVQMWTGKEVNVRAGLSAV